ncbi:30S ribosomal protein S18 [Babesia sp. Xinjiang]|uniref:30S ribosomal protein S18 n=1 Tax=Babesia sp. Xinjiang TaxID=462227 RepID=UPI000A24D82B|nr:30S ribosomal protein S18 [Babesia sp. Xinjiang]ORM39369.1 30S ribosomal protein S18 [Babesia sp. Xinjiang]
MIPYTRLKQCNGLFRKCFASATAPNQPAKKSSSTATNIHAILGADKPTQQQKISEEGSYDALYQECMTEIYKRRAEADGYSEETRDSPEILELTRKEREITKAIFRRADPFQKLIPKLDHKDDYIDPYWDPFKRLDGLKLQVAAEFNDLARLVSAAEVRKQRKMIKQAEQTFEKFCDPYAKEQDGSETTEPLPSDLNERFWDPDVERRIVLENNRRPFSFRDLHVLHNFVAENGQILPRRLTCATRQQQRQIFKAIRVARQMALFPYEWKPRYRDRIPLMDPQQYFADELFHRYKTLGDLRARAMLHVIIKKFPHVNCFRFLKYEAHRFKSNLNFKDTLNKYKST